MTSLAWETEVGLNTVTLDGPEGRGVGVGRQDNSRVEKPRVGMWARDALPPTGRASLPFVAGESPVSK